MDIKIEYKVCENDKCCGQYLTVEQVKQLILNKLERATVYQNAVKKVYQD